MLIHLDRSIQLDRIILFGDSITQQSTDQSLGYALAPALQYHYTRKFDVIVRGFGGYTSAHGRYMIDPILDAEHRPDQHAAVQLLVIFWGSNDSVLPGNSQYVPLESYIENLKIIVQKAQERGITRFILVGPGPFDETRGGTNVRTTEKFHEYGLAAKKIAEEFNVGFLDLWQELLSSVGWKEGDPIPGKAGENSPKSLEHLLPDSLHYSGEAYKVFFNGLTSVINAKYPEIDSSRLSEKMPPWDQAPISELPDCLWK